MPYKATIESTLRNFQYKYIHRIIATNKYLFKCKLSNSNLCDFCSENIETIEHLFWECKHTQPIWNQLTSFLEQQQLNVKQQLLYQKQQLLQQQQQQQQQQQPSQQAALMAQLRHGGNAPPQMNSDYNQNQYPNY
ncbi:hypothetical protein DPMN_192197 [Dreissena polymorpha]|uniref:Reverse transcriptase zinc-binding domain-containing protein n=1 Tax=Dreissena polymorpha TaxID=45954 RepID=A0A9D3XZR5_DREPO|nr:hypothetical protein DPMN_192197 [Dreissena polymorpha]